MEVPWVNTAGQSRQHFVGSMQVGPNNKAIEWTTASSSIYKGADCGSVKPFPLTPEK